MPFNIHINDNADSATVTTIEDGKSVNKSISLDNLIRIFTSLKGVKRDTGYLAANLLREDASNVCNRAYHFKDFISDFRVTCSDTITGAVKKDNKYGIARESNSCLLIPSFHYRDIIGVIRNSNNEAFNASHYQIYNMIPTLTGVVDDSTRLIRIFPNQFSDNICWPSGLNTSEFLNHKDYKVQSTFITRYLTSKFNSDLFNSHMDVDRLSSTDLAEFKEFLKEVFEFNSGEPYDAIYRNWTNVFHFLLYFFMSNIKGMNPTVLVSGNRNTISLGNFFNTTSRDQ